MSDEETKTIIDLNTCGHSEAMEYTRAVGSILAGLGLLLFEWNVTGSIMLVLGASELPLRRTFESSGIFLGIDYSIILISIVGGLILQCNGWEILGIPLIVFGFWYLRYAFWSAVIPINFVPRLRSIKRWVTVTDEEVEKLRSKLTTAESFNIELMKELLFWFAIVCILYLPFRFFLQKVCGLYEYDTFYKLFCVNATIILTTCYFLMSPKTWMPELIVFKLPHFDALIAMLPECGMDNWRKEFQLELSKDNMRNDVPTDIKLMLKPPNCPPEIYGIQAQISINRNLPYMYFVVLAKPTVKIAIPSQNKKDVLEPKKTEEASILVIRQFADKHGGYSTSNNDIARLLRLAKVSITVTINNRSQAAGGK